MGFSRRHAKQALLASNGSVEDALILLLNDPVNDLTSQQEYTSNYRSADDEDERKNDGDNNNNEEEVNDSNQKQLVTPCVELWGVSINTDNVTFKKKLAKKKRE